MPEILLARSILREFRVSDRTVDINSPRRLFLRLLPLDWRPYRN